MTASQDFSLPAMGNAIDDDLDGIRSNYNYLLCIAATGNLVLPGWNTQVITADNDYVYPDSVSLTKGTREIQVKYEYNEDLTIYSIQICYNDGITGLVCFPPSFRFPTDTGSASSDERIIWGGTEFTCSVIETGSPVLDASANLYFYEGSNGLTAPPYDSTCGYYIDEDDLGFMRVISDLAGPASPSNNVPFGTDTFIIKYDLVETVAGSNPVQLLYTTGREGQWWELFRADIRVEDNIGDYTEVVLDVSVAVLDSGDPNAGTAVPVAGTEAVRRVRIIAHKNG